VVPEILTSRSEILAPRRSALLIIDIQNDFIHPSGWSGRHVPDGPTLRHVIPAINGLIDGARRAGVPCAYVTMEHGPDVDEANYQARYAARGMASDILCAAGTWGAQLDKELLVPRPEDLVLPRHSYDGFAGTSLDGWLRSRRVESVVGTGVVTNLCVQTTIQHAFALGYYVAVAEDATAAATPAEHDMTLDNLRRFFGLVLTSAEILDQWQQAA
jgi:ureidoacrylate peracid hydrolase